MSESLDRAAKIAEIIGAIAVVLGLIFVGFEIQENTGAQRFSTTQSLISDYVQALDSLDDKESMCIWMQGMNDFDSLSVVDQGRWSTRMLRIWRPWEQMYYASLDGNVDMRVFESMEGLLMTQTSLKGFGAYWKSRRSFFSNDFQAYIDDLIVRSSDGSSEPYDLTGCSSAPP